MGKRSSRNHCRDTRPSALHAAIPRGLPPQNLHRGPAKPSNLLRPIPAETLPLPPGEQELRPRLLQILHNLPSPPVPFQPCRHLARNFIYPFAHPPIHPFKKVLIRMLLCAADTVVNIHSHGLFHCKNLRSGIENTC